MKKQLLSYAAPMLEAIDSELAEVLCQSDSAVTNESFTDGNWEW